MERVVSAAMILCLSMSVGWLSAFAWRERALIGRLWYESSEQRYLTMTGDVGPVTYLATHDDATAFMSAALALDGVLGVEPYDWPRVSAIAFVDGESRAIDRIRALENVQRLQRKFVPMICH